MIMLSRWRSLFYHWMESIWIITRESKRSPKTIEAIILCDELLIVEKDCLFSSEE